MLEAVIHLPTKKHQGLSSSLRSSERGREQTLLQRLRKAPILLSPWFQHSDLPKRIYFCCFKAIPVCDNLLQPSQEMNTLSTGDYFKIWLKSVSGPSQQSPQKELLSLLLSVKVELSSVITDKPVTSWICTLFQCQHTQGVVVGTRRKKHGPTLRLIFPTPTSPLASGHHTLCAQYDTQDITQRHSPPPVYEIIMRSWYTVCQCLPSIFTQRVKTVTNAETGWEYPIFKNKTKFMP